MDRIKLNIEGMSCGGCVRHVTRALETVPATRIEEVKIGSATVAIDAHATSAKSLVEALAKAGFKATKVPETSEA